MPDTNDGQGRPPRESPSGPERPGRERPAQEGKEQRREQGGFQKRGGYPGSVPVDQIKPPPPNAGPGAKPNDEE